MCIFRTFLLLMLISLSFASYGNSTILVIGDSLSNAHGILSAQGWVNLLNERIKQQNYPYEVVNVSMSGDTTELGLQKLPSALKHYQPAVVIIALGANDGLRGLPASLIQQNLKKLVLLSKQNKAEVLLVGLLMPINYGPVYRKQFEATYQTVVKEFHLIYVPFLLNNIALNPKLMQSDGLHPTAQAQPMILDNIWPFLKRLLKKPRPTA